jgi:hypothetical protein
VIEKISPLKIPIPPKDGVRSVWERRSSGSSYKFFAMAIFIMDGIAKNEIINAVIKLGIISNISVIADKICSKKC